MTYYIMKVAVSAILIVAIAEIAKRSSMIGALPLLLKQGVGFYPSMGISIGVTIACYGLMITLLQQFGIKI